MRVQIQTGRHVSIAALVMGAACVYAQDPSPEKILPPTVEGSWVRTDTNGSGNFENLTSTYTPAELTPKGKQLLDSMPQPNRAPPRYVGGIVVTNPTPCIYNGGQLTVDVDSEGFIAVKSQNEIVQVQDRGSDRHIYLDRTTIPESTMRNPSPSGYSIGHIEPDGTLDVTVSDFAPARVVAGGYRTNKTVLEQKYIPDPDGQHLKLIMTWKDPEIYAKPHIYTYTFERTPKDFTARDEYCDATNPLEGQSVVPREN